MNLVESLEPRRLLSGGGVGSLPQAFVSGTVLRVVAERRGSVIEITTRNAGSEVVVTFVGRGEHVFSRSAIGSIDVTGSDRRDRVTVREQGGALGLPMVIRARGGHDLVDLDLTPARVSGGDGNDLLLGSEGEDTLIGDGGNDRLYGGAGHDLLVGGSGHDDLRGDAGDDQLFGNKGNDQLDGGSGSDFLDGGTGHNRLVDYATVGEINTFVGGKGRNRIFGTTTDLFEDIDLWEDVLVLVPPRPAT
ncbi:MAG: calcium-binding protein [Tepidisphaerales bacterium]